MTDAISQQARAQLEAALGACPGVRAGAVVEQRGAGGSANLVAYVEVEPGTQGLQPRHVLAMLSQRVADALMPAEVRLIDALPRGPDGKVDRARLQSVAGEGRPSDDPFLAEVAAIFSEVLQTPAAADDTLLSLGGDSLQALEIGGRLEERFGATFSQYEFDAERSIAGWADMVRASGKAGVP